MDNKKKVAIYCRVSTYEQAQGNISSLDGQEGSIREYCKQKGWEVYKVYRDTKSGKSFEREEIQNLLNDAEEKKFDIVVATKLDRISRNLLDFLQFDIRVKALGIDTVITTQNIDTSTIQGKLIRDIMLVFAQFEREMIAERTREKMYFQASKGYWTGGHVLLGYDVKDKKLVINKEEEKIVKKVFEQYLEGKSFGEIANELNKAGYKPKQRFIKGKVSGAGEFNKDSVGRILKNKIYMGIISITQKLEGKEKVEDFKGLHLPIIEKDIFEKVQFRIGESAKNKFVNYNKSELLLLNKLKCGFCGSAMTTSFSKHKNEEKYYYYKCNDKMKYGAKKCACKDIAAEEIEDFVLKLVFQIGSSDKLFDAVFNQFNANESDEKLKLKEAITDLKRNLAQVNSEINNLLNFISQSEKIKNLRTTEDKLSALDEKKNFIQEEIAKMQVQLENIENEVISKDELREVFKNLSTWMKELGKDEQRQLIGAIISEIRWYLKTGQKEGEIEIFFRGDGAIKRKWANKVDPSDLVSSFHLDWLRG